MDAITQACVEEWRRRMNAGEYFGAHEVVEEAWLRAAEPEKTFLKGLIHIAVALHHYRRGNAHGARVKYGSAVRYLAPYAPEFAGIHVEALLAQLEGFFRPLLEQNRSLPPPEPTAPWPMV